MALSTSALLFFVREESQKMGGLLLTVIYLIFISLGLPDSLLGSGWPKMQVVFGVPSSYA